MPWYGRQLQNRDAVALVARHWPNQKVKAQATMNAESRRFVGAIREYPNGDCDAGLMQHNIDASQRAELQPKLWTDSKDPVVYMPVARANVRLAYQKWNSPWIRNGELSKRFWQPWVAYTSGWAMFPQAWVWRHEKDEDGKLTIPVGPWVKTGRYLHEAVRGVCNWHLLINGSLGIEGAKRECERLLDQYGVKDCGVSYSDRQAVYIVYPKAPTEPPADGHGPRPVPNDGR